MRTEDQTIAGIFWAYDGVMGIGGPVRLYNQMADVAVKEALEQGAPEVATAYQLARFYAVLHVTIGDATVAVRFSSQLPVCCAGPASALAIIWGRL